MAGTSAEGALPKAATPYGKLNTPAPTMLLTRLKTRLGMLAVPPLLLLLLLSEDESLAPPFKLVTELRRAVVVVRFVVDVGIDGCNGATAN